MKGSALGIVALIVVVCCALGARAAKPIYGLLVPENDSGEASSLMLWEPPPDTTAIITLPEQPIAPKTKTPEPRGNRRPQPNTTTKP